VAKNIKGGEINRRPFVFVRFLREFLGSSGLGSEKDYTLLKELRGWDVL